LRRADRVGFFGFFRFFGFFGFGGSSGSGFYGFWVLRFGFYGFGFYGFGFYGFAALRVREAASRHVSDPCFCACGGPGSVEDLRTSGGDFADSLRKLRGTAYAPAGAWLACADFKISIAGSWLECSAARSFD